MTYLNLRKIKPETRALFDTLENVGKFHSIPKYELLAYAPAANQEKLNATHHLTNTTIQRCLEGNSLGTCIHITGRMSALNDPYHANLCKNIFQNSNDPFKFTYFDQGQPDVTAINIIKQKVIMWGKVNWRQTISLLRSEAMSHVEIFANAEQEKFQYTIFGNEYVQIQSAHSVNGTKKVDKNVWLIKSEGLYDELKSRSEIKLSKRNHVSAQLLREAVLLLTGTGSRIVFNELISSETGEHAISNIKSLISDYTETPDDIIEAQRELGFLEIDANGISRITQEGRHFSELLG